MTVIGINTKTPNALNDLHKLTLAELEELRDARTHEIMHQDGVNFANALHQCKEDEFLKALYEQIAVLKKVKEEDKLSEKNLQQLKHFEECEHVLMEIGAQLFDIQPGIELLRAQLRDISSQEHAACNYLISKIADDLQQITDRVGDYI